MRGIALGLWAATLGMILLRFLNNAGRNGRAALILASAYAANALFNLVAWRLVGPSGNGSILIGIGEASRGLVLLAGTAFALNALWPLSRLLRVVRPLAAALAALCFSSSKLERALGASVGWRLRVPRNDAAGRPLLMPGEVAAWRGRPAMVRQ